MSPPWLLIDAGNSRIKWALAPGQPHANWCAAHPAFLASGATSHEGWHQLADDIGESWQTLAAQANTRPSPRPQGVWLSNVAGEATEQAVRMTLQTLWGIAASDHLKVLHSSAAAAGVTNPYATPSHLGTDRWASLIGAHAAYPGEHLLIVTLGTATTVDALSATGEFLGGVIAPGPAMMLSSLAQGTAQLPHVDADTQAAHPSLEFADNTRDALIAGCLGAQAGLIERNHAALQHNLKAPVRCVLAGGARGLLAPALSIPFTEHDSLVLAGLYQLASHPSDCGDH